MFSLVSLTKSKLFACVAIVLLVLHSCCLHHTRAALVLLVSDSCCTGVPSLLFVSLVSRTRLVK